MEAVTIHLAGFRYVTVLSVLVDARLGWFPLTESAASAGRLAVTVPLPVIPETATL